MSPAELDALEARLRSGELDAYTDELMLAAADAIAALRRECEAATGLIGGLEAEKAVLLESHAAHRIAAETADALQAELAALRRGPVSAEDVDWCAKCGSYRCCPNCGSMARLAAHREAK